MYRRSDRSGFHVDTISTVKVKGKIFVVDTLGVITFASKILNVTFSNCFCIF